MKYFRLHCKHSHRAYNLSYIVISIDKGNLVSQLCDLFSRPKVFSGSNLPPHVEDSTATTSKKVMKPIPTIIVTSADGLTDVSLSLKLNQE